MIKVKMTVWTTNPNMVGHPLPVAVCPMKRDKSEFTKLNVQ